MWTYLYLKSKNSWAIYKVYKGKKTESNDVFASNCSLQDDHL